MKRGAFTLLELLVVIALIAVLAGLFLPALARARGAASTARCGSNLRQLGLAVRMYWDDHAGRVFPEGAVRTNGGTIYWFGWLEDGSEGQREFDPRPGKLWPYLQGRGVEMCPGLDRTSPHFKSKSRGAAFGYGYNLHLGPRETGGGAHRPGIRADQLAAPEELAVFADCAQINDFQAPASPERPMLEEFYYFETETPTVHFRHHQRAGILFADGHVGTDAAAPDSLDHRLPGQSVGRLVAERILPRFF